MAITAGDSACTTGLSGAIYSAWSGDAANGFSSPLSAPQLAMVKAQCYRWAVAIANAHNADGVSSTVNVQDEGVAKGAAGTVNFVGAGVTAAVAGGVATVTIPGGGAAVTFVDGETPSGTPNGSLTTFGLAVAPSPATSLHLYRNGVRLKPTTDYSLAGSTITFVAAPDTGDVLLADYRY